MQVLIIANAKAGQGVPIPSFLRRLLRVPVREHLGAADLRRRVQDALRQYDLSPVWVDTLYPGHATELAKDAVAQNIDIVVAVGGDGTVNEVVNGLAGSRAALGIIPAGTANLLAGELSIPADVEGACAVLAAHKERVIDLPFVDERYFTMMAGIGFDAHVVRLVDRRLKGRWGIFSYLIVTVRELMRYRFERIEICTDTGERLDGFYMFVQNAQSYGSGYCASPDSRMDDGVMELIVFPGRSLFTVVQYLLSPTKGRFKVEKRTIRELELSSAHDIQIDGDFFGQGPAKIGIKCGFLRVIVP